MATFNREETLKLISDVAKEHGDKFRIQLKRRVSRGMESVAIFDEARAEHCSFPETWVSTFAGGGEYWLSVSHSESPQQQIGGVITYVAQGAPLATIDPNVVNNSDWQGPTKTTWVMPPPIALPVQPQSQQQQAPPVSLATALPLDPGAASKMLAEKAEQLQRAEREIAAKDKELALAQKDLEGRHKEFEAKRDGFQDRMREHERRLDEKIRDVRPVDAPRSSEGLTELGKALVPGILQLVTQMQQNASEQRIERMKLENERLKTQMEGELRRDQRDLEARKETLMMFTNLIKEMRESQKEQMLELRNMIEKQTKQPGMDDQMKGVFSSMSSAFGQLANTTMSMVAAATQLQDQGQPQTDWAGALTGIARSVADAAKTYFQTKPGATVPGTGQPQLPPAQNQNQDQQQTQAPAQEQPKAEEEDKPPTTADDSRAVMEKLVERVKGGETEIQVAAAFLNSFEVNEWFAFKVRSAPDLTTLFGPLLADWVMEDVAKRGPYLEKIGKAIDTEAERRQRAEQGRKERETAASTTTQPPASA